MEAPLLTLRNVEVSFASGKRKIPALHEVSLDVRRGEVLGIVGESGCGKSLTSLSVMGLLPSSAELTGGEMTFEEANLGTLGEEEWCRIRGRRISMIFQDPMTTLNPLIPIGRQIAETLGIHRKITKRKAKEEALDMMSRVGLPRAESLYDEYPHQLSGGMRQRAVIAMALICGPQLLIADEPTTALDVTIQAQILDLLREINEKTGTSILFISHDLGVIREICDRVIVMYAGYVVEEAPADELIRSPKHPYTVGLLQSIPDAAKRGEPLYTIPGRVLPPDQRGGGCCPFADRCPSVMPACLQGVPALERQDGNRSVRCLLYAERKEGST